MPQESGRHPDAARRRYFVIQSVLALAFAGVIVATSFAVPRAESVAAKWLLSAGPIALLTLWAWEFFRIVKNEDEMLQGLHLRTIALSAGLVLVGATMWGVLERLLALPAFPLFLLLPAFAFLYGVVWMVMRSRG